MSSTLVLVVSPRPVYSTLFRKCLAILKGRIPYFALLTNLVAFSSLGKTLMFPLMKSRMIFFVPCIILPFVMKALRFSETCSRLSESGLTSILVAMNSSVSCPPNLSRVERTIF